MEKKCFKCSEIKNLACFNKHPKTKDGHLNKCNSCSKADSKIYRLNNIEHYRKFDRDRAPRQTKEYRDKYESKFPKKLKARREILNSIRCGDIKNPKICSICNAKPKRVYGHHDDYDFPLIVRWLCGQCHKDWHVKNGEGLNAR